MFCMHCGKRNEEDARHCNFCGHAIGSEPVQRHGKDLIVFQKATLPPFCVKCGATPRRERLKTTYYWHTPLLYLLFLLGACLIYLIVALIVRKRFPIELPLCEAHFRRRRALLWTGGLLAIGAIPLGFALGTYVSEAAGGLAGIGVFLIGLVLVTLGSSLLRPVRITNDVAVFRGAGEAFLAHVPAGPPPVLK